MTARFRDTGPGSFWGGYVYEEVVPKKHFLRQLAELIDWDSLTEGLADHYKGGAEYGSAPYHPATLLKMPLVSYLYKLSERATELFVADSLAARYFVGIAADEPVPDHSTLSVFRERILKQGGTEAYEGLFRRIVQQARVKGIRLGWIQVVDATHSIADVDVWKDKERKKKGGKPRAKDANWGSKGKRKVKTADGQSAEVNKTFHSYKAHVSLNAESGLITSVVTTTGRMPDGQQSRPIRQYNGRDVPVGQFAKLVAKDEEVGVEAEVYAGDKGYDDGENHELLWAKGKQSALILKRYRTQKKDDNKGPWLKLKESAEYQAGKKERYKVEQKFGEGKRCHGWGRCRYLGLAKYGVQSFLTAMALNLKRMVRLLSGVGPRPARMGLARG